MSIVLACSFWPWRTESAIAASCPTQLEPLVAQLLPELPSYANRVVQRSRRLDSDRRDITYIMLAGRAEFEPLSLGLGEPPPAEPQQVFFTTLERQYTGDRQIDRQNYYWLFLTQADDGWRLAALYLRFGTTRDGGYPSPPREASNGVIGRAIQLWLRDCRAGAVRSRTDPPD
ncbi:MAG: hypothetical protein HC838_03330 [Spirulinaceae cyanobacterium RM2_2_10]|nr:hypothetical protein [Spirulinaceae cyanobacterium SM2_1_0]NJO19286.1 hypothetical protein [Spirulinaceae cyanobacterium RM2_2_10]